jgi:hypothetical protein
MSKSKAVPLHAMEARGGRGDIAPTNSEPRHITPRPRFTPEKGPPVPIGQEAGWDPEPVWTQRLEEISSASVGDRTPVVQSVVSRYTDWATPAPVVMSKYRNYCTVYNFDMIKPNVVSMRMYTKQ